MRNRHLKILSAALLVLGLGVFAYRVLALGLPLRPDETVPVWTVEARMRFSPPGGPVKAGLRIPSQPPGFELLDEHFVSFGYGLTTQAADDDRQALWSKRRARGLQTLYYRAIVYRTRVFSPPDDVPGFPEVPDYPEPFGSAARSVLEDVRDESADITTFASLLVKRLNAPAPDGEVRLLLGEGRATPDGKVDTAIRLLAGARIPAQKIRGLLLRERQRDVPLTPWLAVHNGQRWVYVNPDSGVLGLPDDFLVWCRGDEPILDVPGARRPGLDFSVMRSTYGSLEVAQQRSEIHGPSPFDLSLFGLPIRTQAVYQILVLLPVGGLIVVLMRNVVGVATLGTFMPILIAIAFRETRLVWGIVLFTLVVALGLGARRYLARLKLLVVPRLAAVLTVVILVLVGLSLVTHALGLERGLSVALFPIVILTMVIERVSVLWEERGGADAFREALGSLAVAVIAYGVFLDPQVQHLTFVFPELLLLVLAATLVLGRYSGYRLLELRRFRSLAREVPGA